MKLALSPLIVTVKLDGRLQSCVLTPMFSHLSASTTAIVAAMKHNEITELDIVNKVTQLNFGTTVKFAAILASLLGVGGGGGGGGGPLGMFNLYIVQICYDMKFIHLRNVHVIIECDVTTLDFA